MAISIPSPTSDPTPADTVQDAPVLAIQHILDNIEYATCGSDGSEPDNEGSQEVIVGTLG